VAAGSNKTRWPITGMPRSYAQTNPQHDSAQQGGSSWYDRLMETVETDDRAGHRIMVWTEPHGYVYHGYYRIADPPTRPDSTEFVTVRTGQTPELYTVEGEAYRAALAEALDVIRRQKQKR
jgi:hypothetical protein